MGYKKNIFNYLYKSQALICSSIWEEPGFIIQEAAATKTNIITSNCPNGPGEFIEFGKTGFLFKNNNKNSFYLTLLKFLKTSKNEKKKMIKKNYLKVKNYSPKFFYFNFIKILGLN